MCMIVICNKDKEMDWEKLAYISYIYIERENPTIE
jgi:hypothetical protein